MRASTDRKQGTGLRIVLALTQTLFDIIRLRKGPDAIPYSPVLFALMFAAWLVAGFIMTASTPEMDARDFAIGTISGIAGLVCYSAIILLAGKGPRLLQAATALLGCGAMLSVIFVVANASMTPLLAAGTTNLIVTLILLWSVPVEGHIISRTIDRHWYVGVMIAMAVFVFQLVVYSLIDPAAGTAS